VKAHWTDRTDPLFVEVAEAIGTTTDLVMAASPRGEYVVAMATPDLDEHSRDFVKCILKREVEVGGLDELEAFIKRGLGT
jgi:hypothetical protein